MFYDDRPGWKMRESRYAKHERIPKEASRLFRARRKPGQSPIVPPRIGLTVTPPGLGIHAKRSLPEADKHILVRSWGSKWKFQV
jgi:hypothetical protein